MKQMVIHASGQETAVAMLENNLLMEFFVDGGEESSAVGHIYLGRVVNVLPGMQAAFVDIGQEKNAFLYVEDALPPGAKEHAQARPAIGDVVKVNERLLVQIVKEAYGSKGARITTHLSIPGRMLVYFPHGRHIGISRKIEEEGERERLKDLGETWRQGDEGIIFRTAANQVAEDELQADLSKLRQIWQDLLRRSGEAKAPALIYRDLSLVPRMIRDALDDSLDEILIDDHQVYQHIRSMIETDFSDWPGRLSFVNDSHDIMDELGIYQQIEKALHRKVWLKSGGYIVIDRTEALTAIDVNTGKYTGSDNLEQTVWRTNREAVKEIARQVRLRDIGGMIIIDFIDMADPSHRKDVLEALTDAFRDDRSRTTIQGLTQLGLVEMTRKKSRHDLESLFMIVCPTCLGRGKIYKHTSQVDNIIRRLFELKEEHDSEAFFVEVNSHLGAQIIGPAGSRLEQLEKSLGRKIYVKGSDTMMAHQVEIRQGTEAQVRKWAIPVEKGELIELYIEEKHMNYPENGIGRISGFVINVKNGAQYLHQKVKVLITEVNRTFARGIVKAPPK